MSPTATRRVELEDAQTHRPRSSHLVSYMDRPTCHPPTHGTHPRIKDASESPSSQPHGPIRHGRTVHALINRPTHAAMEPRKGGFIFSLRIRPFEPKRAPMSSLTHLRLPIHLRGIGGFVMTAPLGLGSVRPLPPLLCPHAATQRWGGGHVGGNTGSSGH